MKCLKYNRCPWVNLNNEQYVEYHDKEWGVPAYDDNYLFEILLLETFQAGLSWECVLNKRAAFALAFDQFSYHQIAQYDTAKVDELMQNKGIIRNRLKIEAQITNAQVFMQIQKEWGFFAKYLWHFTDNKVIKGDGTLVTSPLSDTISEDLKKRGMRFVASTSIYAYLQAVGIINDHTKDCYKY